MAVSARELGCPQPRAPCVWMPRLVPDPLGIPAVLTIASSMLVHRLPETGTSINGVRNESERREEKQTKELPQTSYSDQLLLK